MQAFCTGRDIPTAGVRIRQSWERDEQKRLTKIHLEIQVPPEFPERYHKALLRAASQCSVKKVLENPPTIETTLAPV